MSAGRQRCPRSSPPDEQPSPDNLLPNALPAPAPHCCPARQAGGRAGSQGKWSCWQAAPAMRKGAPMSCMLLAQLCTSSK